MSSRGYTELESQTAKVSKTTRYAIGLLLGVVAAACLACIAVVLNKSDFTHSSRTTFLAAIDLAEPALPEKCSLRNIMQYCKDLSNNRDERNACYDKHVNKLCLIDPVVKPTGCDDAEVGKYCWSHHKERIAAWTCRSELKKENKCQKCILRDLKQDCKDQTGGDKVKRDNCYAEKANKVCLIDPIVKPTGCRDQEIGRYCWSTHKEKTAAWNCRLNLKRENGCKKCILRDLKQFCKDQFAGDKEKLNHCYKKEANKACSLDRVVKPTGCEEIAIDKYCWNTKKEKTEAWNCRYHLKRENGCKK